MFLDARHVPRGASLTADICIVGAGAAGLSIAQRLAGTGLIILLVESGGLRIEHEPQMLNRGTSNHVDYPFKTSRVRAFGGTTTRWTGACIPLDRVDFESRPWLAHSGWPIGLDDLTSYYDIAASVFGIPPTASFQEQLNRSPFSSGNLESKAVFYSTPLDLGRKYRGMIGRAHAITCILNGSATQLYPGGSGKRVDSLEIRSQTGNLFTVRPRAVVLAAGGIENARLLLASNSAQPAGLGNTNDTVGRYYMEHPIKAVGILPVASRGFDALPYTNRVQIRAAEAQGTVGLSRECRTKEMLLDMHLRFYRYHRLEGRPAVIAAKAAALELTVADWQAVLAKVWRRHRSSIGTEVLPYVVWHVWNKLNIRARFEYVRFAAFVEQEPDPANRITLSSAKDAHGFPMPHLHYHESDFMKKSIRRSLGLMRAAFRAKGYGNLRFETGSIAHLAHYDKYGLHHMGSTRMSDDPRHGVVDRNCQVHGMTNLFIVGSSVFSTGGAANPTFTIVALSLRLADHLCKVIRQI